VTVAFDLSEVAARLARVQPRPGHLDVLNLGTGLIVFGDPERVTVRGGGRWTFTCPECLCPVVADLDDLDGATMLHLAATPSAAHRVEANPAPDGGATLMLVHLRVKIPKQQQSQLAPVSPPTDAQLQVLRLAADGLTNAEIAARLGRSTDTVRTHMQKIRERFGVRSATQAVAVAFRRGWLT